MSRVQALRRVSLFAGLAEEELLHLADALARRVYDRGVVIFHEGDPGDALYIVESGRARIFILSESGQEITVDVFGPGEVFGELSVLDGLPRSAGAVAVDHTVCLILRRDDLMRALAGHPQMALALIRVLSSRLRRTTRYAEGLAFLDVCGRVAAKLLELGERHGATSDGMQLELRLSQRELATWAGTSRESVNKVLRMMQKRGLIAIEGSRVTLLDHRGLRDLATY